MYQKERTQTRWVTHSTGPMAHDRRGINLVTKGRALAGAWIGAITGDAGTIGTTELANQAVTSTKLGAGAVGDSNVFGTVETISTLDTTLTKTGVALLTKATTVVLAVTIPAPTAGAWKAIHNDSTTAVGFTLTCATTTVTFDGANKTITFNAFGDLVQLAGSGTTRWVVIANNSAALS